VSDVRWSDRKIVLWMGAVILLLIIVVSVLAPNTGDDDARPTTYNTGPQGAKAAFLTLQAIGKEASRWTRPLSDLSKVDASHTTLVLAAPMYSPTEQEAIARALKPFLERGGSVLTTGPTGALLLPGGKTTAPTNITFALCATTPADGPLAAAGKVTILDGDAWDGPKSVEVAHRCGQDAVVVRMKVGRGEAVWWSSAIPLTNAELTKDADLRLLLLSLGDGRSVLWDESLHETVPGLWDAAHGLPLWWLIVQIVLLAVLLILSFSRRNGPVRAPVTVPRSSPVEFAYSMGDLYEKGRATLAATDAARRRLLRAVTRDAGVPQGIVDDGPKALGSALKERLGGDWTMVSVHLERADEAAKEIPTYREALVISRALSEDAEKIRAAARSGRARDVRVTCAR
jgi:Domain of unknown function (DUF4350)